MYPTNTEFVYSYFEARPGSEFDKTTFFGLQYLIKNWLEGEVVTTEGIDKAEKLANRHFGNDKIFNRARWDYIVEKHNGRLPVEICAVPEGSVIPINNVMMTVVNTDPECYWLTNHLETLLCQVWYPSTVATKSRATKEMFEKYLEQTSDNKDGIDFMLHDFGMRGVSSMESAGIGGAGHLLNFLGTDTVIAMEYIEEYYGGIETGFSVPATEHSVMTARGEAGEVEVIEQLLQNHPTGILSVVSDSYDIYRCVDEYYGVKFKEQILARDGKFVVRPDSGDPVEVVCGNLKDYSTTLQEEGLLRILWRRFSGTLNSKGYKVLNPKIGLIWGDGIDIDGIEAVLKGARAIGFDISNLVFGQGGGLLQKLNRDTQRFAFKSSAQKVKGEEWKDIFKDPLDSSKKSKRGKLALMKSKDGEYMTTRLTTNNIKHDVMHCVFKDGTLMVDYDFDEVKGNSTN